MNCRAYAKALHYKVGLVAPWVGVAGWVQGWQFPMAPWVGVAEWVILGGCGWVMRVMHCWVMLGHALSRERDWSSAGG